MHKKESKAEMVIKWKEDENNENIIVWSYESEIARVLIKAERIAFSIEWKMWLEINNHKGKDGNSITVPNKKCVVSMITSMKGIINNYLIEANKSGKKIEDVIKSQLLI